MSYYITGIQYFDRTSNFNPQGAMLSVICDAVSDLPTAATMQTDTGYTPIIGTTAQVIADSSTYVLNSGGTWVLQEGEIFQNVYTKTDIDTMFANYYTDSQIDSMFAALPAQYFVLGTNIEDATDLDTLTTPGVYVCTSAAHAGTLVHCPVSSAFRMEVKYTALTSRFIQQIQAGAASIYIRNKYSNTAWNHWHKFEGTDTGA